VAPIRVRRRRHPGSLPGAVMPSDATAVELLLHLLVDSHPAVRQAAAAGLARLSYHTGVVPALQWAERHDEDHGVRRAASDALEGYGS